MDDYNDLSRHVQLLAKRFVVSVLRHPWRSLLCVAAVGFLGWLSGYDVR